MSGTERSPSGAGCVFRNTTREGVARYSHRKEADRYMSWLIRGRHPWVVAHRSCDAEAARNYNDMPLPNQLYPVNLT